MRPRLIREHDEFDSPVVCWISVRDTPRSGGRTTSRQLLLGQRGRGAGTTTGVQPADLDTDRAAVQAQNNVHHDALMRSSGAHLMDFLSQSELLTRPAMAIQQRAHML